MKKRMTVTLNIPVTLDVIADDKGGDVVVTDVLNVTMPSRSDINNASTDDNLAAIDEAFSDSTQVIG